MRSRIGPILVLGAVLAACGLLGFALWSSRSGLAQGTDLAGRVERLRREVDRIPTDASNFPERASTLEAWWDSLAASGKLEVPTILTYHLYLLRTEGFKPRSHALVRAVGKALAYAADHGAGSGALARLDASDLVAHRYVTLVFEYTVGTVPLGRGAGLRLGQMAHANRVQQLQTTDPSRDAYVKFEVASGRARIENHAVPVIHAYSSVDAPKPMPGMRVSDGALEKGDRIRITIGDRSGGSRGYRLPTHDADRFRFVVELDPDGEGMFVMGATATVAIRGEGATAISAVVPSVVRTGEGFALRLRVEDEFRNPATFAGGTFAVRLSGQKVGEVRVPAGSSTGRMEGLRFSRAGGYRFDVSSDDGRFACQSNPVLAEERPRERVYWGELHGHSGWEEATGSVPRYYEFARDYAYLDFGSLTGHDVFLAPPGWDEIRRETEGANRPGSFVAFMGYEWTVGFNIGAGHHNVFFRNDPGRYVTLRDANQLPQLYAKLRRVDAPANILIIPHAHDPGNWNYNDPDMERLVEIFSKHGSFEYFGQRFLQQGYRVGFIGASDDHTGHPGYTTAVESTRPGLAAVYAPELTRDSLWKALKERATFATSGHRPVVRVDAAGRRAGESVRAGEIPELRVRALGTAPIDHIDLVHNNQVEYTADFMRARDGEETAVHVMLHSPTESPGSDLVRPLPTQTWSGWIEVTGARIRSIEPLGLDHYTDGFHQVDDRRIWFACYTRGDFDGVLIRLADSPADATITIRLHTSQANPDRAALEIPRPPEETTGPRAHFRLGDVAARPGRLELTRDAIVFARQARARGQWDVSFRYRPTKPAAPGDYFYARVVQADGEVAWTSPIWIPEQVASKPANR